MQVKFDLDMFSMFICESEEVIIEYIIIDYWEVFIWTWFWITPGLLIFLPALYF